MICTACNIGIHFVPASTTQVIPRGAERRVGDDVAVGFCPECQRRLTVARVVRYEDGDMGPPQVTDIYSQRIIDPLPSASAAAPPEVPTDYAAEYIEARNVLSASPKASAALCRRVLQRLLREHYNVKSADLAREIDEFLARQGIPTHLADAIDPIRHIGNLAAHPVRDRATGDIVPVEPGEAEWLLEAIDALFDFAFVQPQRLAARRKALNAKLAAAGKPPLK